MIWFDVLMGVVFFLLGLYFYSSNGRAANILSGYNARSDEERKQYDETAMCKNYGIRLIIMAIPFFVGAVIDHFRAGVGSALAWAVWLVLLVILLMKRNQLEKKK